MSGSNPRYTDAVLIAKLLKRPFRSLAAAGRTAGRTSPPQEWDVFIFPFTGHLYLPIAGLNDRADAGISEKTTAEKKFQMVFPSNRMKTLVLFFHTVVPQKANEVTGRNCMLTWKPDA